MREFCRRRFEYIERDAVAVIDFTIHPRLLAFTIDLCFHFSPCSHIAGLSASRAENIIKYRTENGPFKSRNELLKVKSIGPVSFLQCAGFVRIEPITANIPRGSKLYCVLDSTWVHPESYDVAMKIIKKLGCTMCEIGTAAFIAKITKYLAENELNMERLCREYGIPAERVSDFIYETNFSQFTLLVH